MNRKIAYLGLIAVCFGMGVALWPDNSSKQVLADGTVLVLSGLKLGPTNVYTQGTWLSKTLGRFAPATGISLLGVELRPPEKFKVTAPPGAEVLSARILLQPGSPREAALLFSPGVSSKFRWVMVADDGKSFVRAFTGFRKQAAGALSYFYTGTFPRESRQLRIRLEERDNRYAFEWRTVAEFVVKNPKSARIESWTPQQLPRLRLAESLEMETGELVVRPGSIHSPDWGNMAFLPLRFTSNGQVVTNWGIHGRDDGDVRDASGNFERFTVGEAITNDWTICRIVRPLDPARVWRFRINVARQSDFLATNLYSFTIPWPLATPIQTNLGGFPVRIGYDSTRKLSVELTNKPPGTRLTFVNAVNDAGNKLDTFGGSSGQHSVWRSLELSKPMQVHATVAIHPNYEVTFTLAPRDETAASHPDDSQPDSK